MGERNRVLEDRIVIHSHRIILQTQAKEEEGVVQSTLFCEKDTGRDSLGSFETSLTQGGDATLQRFHTGILSLFFQELQKHQNNALLASQALTQEVVCDYMKTKEIFQKPLPQALDNFCKESTEDDVLAIYLFSKEDFYNYLNPEHQNISQEIEKNLYRTQHFLKEKAQHIHTLVGEIEQVNILFLDYQLFYQKQGDLTIVIVVDSGKTGYFINKVNTIFNTIQSYFHT